MVGTSVVVHQSIKFQLVRSNNAGGRYIRDELNTCQNLAKIKSMGVARIFGRGSAF